MGSFNSTCFASNQTIAPGDRARVMAISQSKTFRPVQVTYGSKQHALFGITDSTCYPNAFWRPVTRFMPATYDDYGHFELDLSTCEAREQVLFFCANLWRHAGITAQGENQYHDTAFDLKAWAREATPALAEVLAESGKGILPSVETDGSGLEGELAKLWEYVTGTCHEHRLFFHDSHGELRPLELACLHEEAYQALIATLESTQNWDKQSNPRAAFAKRQLQEAREHWGRLDEPAADEKQARMNEFHFANSLAESLNRMSGNVSMPRAGLLLALLPLAGSLMKGDELVDKYVEVVTPMLADSYALGALEMLNLRITPQVYAGQDYGNELGRAYAKFIRKVSAKVSQGRRSRD